MFPGQNELMNSSSVHLAGAAVLLLQLSTLAATSVKFEQNTSNTPFTFRLVPQPSSNDAAATAQFSIAQGQRDRNGGDLAVLHDGRVPTEDDQPAANFFFGAGSAGGRIRVDLGRLISIKAVNTYSWHSGNRAAQVYRLYAAQGTESNFHAAPGEDIDLGTSGWRLMASVDTRSNDAEPGGQHGVSISSPEQGHLGEYRYLLFEMERTEDRDAFGNTFYSEIDIIDANGPTPIPIAAGPEKQIVSSFAADGGKYHFSIDATAAPDLMDWAEKELRPVVQEWYPKIVGLLPSEGFEPRTNITLRFRNDMGGTPASAGGSRINLNSSWFRKELNREARGSVVHELVHVVQSYGNTRRTNPSSRRTPGWLVEGLADYIRWFLYEPQTRGAEITARNLARAKFDASYRITGNFLNWVTQTYDRDIVSNLNAAARKGQYSPELWKERTGKTVEELGDEWLKGHQARLSSQATDAPSSIKSP